MTLQEHVTAPAPAKRPWYERPRRRIYWITLVVLLVLTASATQAASSDMADCLARNSSAYCNATEAGIENHPGYALVYATLPLWVLYGIVATVTRLIVGNRTQA